MANFKFSESLTTMIKSIDFNAYIIKASEKEINISKYDDMTIIVNFLDNLNDKLNELSQLL